MKRFAWVMGLFLLAGAGQAWGVPYGELLDAPTLPTLYGKQVNIKTPQKVFRLNEFDAQNHAYPWVQINIGGEKLEFFPHISAPYLDDTERDKDPGSFLEIDFVFRNNGSEPVTVKLDAATWKLLTVGANKLLYVNPLVKLADATDGTLRNVNILWEASPKNHTPPSFTGMIQATHPGSAIIPANFDISHALKIAQETTQGRTLPQMFLVVGDAVAYEIPPYTLPRSGPDKATVDRIVENVEKALGDGQ
jgi:hypothetical protein